MSWRFGVMLLIVPVLIVTALRSPLSGVFSTMVMYYFRPGIWGKPGWWEPVFWITAATAIGWALKAKDVRMTPGLGVSGILVLTMLVSSGAAWENSNISFSCTVVILKLVAMQFLIIQLVRDMKQVWAFLWINMIANLWTLKSVVVITLLSGDASRANVAAAQGGGANYLAMVFVMAIPLLFFGYLYGKPRVRKFCMILAPLHILAIVGTGSRGGFLTLFCVFAFLAIRSKRKMMGFGVTVFALIFMAIVTPQAKWERFMTTFRGEETRKFAAQSRIELWKAGWKMFTEAPVTGVGHDNFQILSPRYTGFFAGDTPRPYDPALDGTKGYTGFVTHSTWFQSLAEGGLIGSIPFFALFIMCFHTLYRVRRIRLEPDDQKEVYIVSQLIEATFWAFIVSSSFGSHFKIDTLWWFFGITAAFGMVVDEKAKVIKRREQEENLARRAEKWKLKGAEDAVVVGHGEPR